MAHARHKRDTDARRFGPKLPRAALVAAPVAVVATAAAVTVGLASAGTGDDQITAAAADLGTAASKSVPKAAVALEDRGTSVSRSLNRRQAVKARTGKTQWTTAALDLWKRPGEHADKVGEAKEATKVLVTGRELDGRVEIVVDGAARWVTAGHLADDKPLPEPPGISMQPCPDSSVEDGLKPQTIKVYRSVCHAFPEVSEYGGLAARSEHNTGNALDVMVYGDKALGDRIADWAHEHAAELDVYDLIWWDRIWTPVRSSEGWRDYGDHGSATANHMDHVHIGTN
ncbi:hypothetical protein SAMN04487968_10111 [Nocardioides terrae]|uniref:ARB-07466-like C-terminal domain-containing protein n=1 Tax=Nocardioides terrae TaxID=574651 RepID=A0A1I1D9P2_9ACTN|nr:hypothetical protein [Nocardioides terrae]SFB69808.1 hypothetical protein SAMN04487968_10111 [Nocardioides terrae]